MVSQEKNMSEQTKRYRDGPGYDHELYPWSMLNGRKSLEWPGGARIALACFVHLENFEIDPPSGAIADPRFGGALGSYDPDYQNHTRRLHGLRVGYFRVLEILERYGVKATITFNSSVAESYPYLVERALKGGHGLVARGVSARQMISQSMSEQEEKTHIQHSIDTLERISGRSVKGWAGQDMGESDRTPRILKELGLTHVIDWPNDDIPYPMDVSGNGDTPLISIPNQTEWDDAELFAVRHVDPWRYPEIFRSAFNHLYNEGGQMFGFGVHPWIFGQAFRIKYLEEAISVTEDMPGIWRATSDEIAEWTISNL